MAFPAPSQPPVTSLPLPDPEAYEGEPREYARALMQRKEEIEKAIDTMNDVLASHGSNASTSLVDPEGFPRGDIDIYSIRHARSALAHLATDLRAVNDLLPNALAQAFQAGSTSQSVADTPTPLANGSAKTPTANGHGPPATRGGDLDMPDAWPSRPIAKVNSVEARSPAAEANLQAGDEIFSFSGITATSGGNLRAIGALVQSSEGRSLVILVQRRDERLRLRLTPRSGWGGRGSLGCHILPV